MAMEALPAPGSIEEAMQLMQLSTMMPNASPEHHNTTAAKSNTTTTGSATWKRRLHPKHRQAVRNFFDEDR
ncbi:MAG: hypothetical protein OTJ44_00210 [Planctomycetota bacterium]|jgi:hypothetical protein|nr:hypothetical protein [Planctomycetota bacterium]